MLSCITDLNAQKKGFIVNSDGTREKVTIYYDRSTPNSVQVEISKNSKSTYLPADLQSFGFTSLPGGKVTYVSVANGGSDEPNVFMRQLVSASLALLELQEDVSRFFYQSTNGVIEITKSDLGSTLNKLAEGKPFWELQPEKIRFSKAHLISFFKAINKGNKAQPNFSDKRLSFSIISGKATLAAIELDNHNSVAAEADLNAFSFGASIYVPIKTSLRFGINAQLSLEQFSFYNNTRTAKSDQDATVMFDRFLIELTPTYKLTFGRLSSYAFFGVAVGHVLKDRSEFFIADFNNNEIQFRSHENTYSTNQHLGMSGGVGLNFHISPKMLSGLEFRWSSTSVTESSLDNLDTYRLTLNLGF
ncbi:MAG: hypothetical protein Roseis2KO_39630 [Roseivirga sp.]